MNKSDGNIVTSEEITKAVENTLQSENVKVVQYEVRPASDSLLGFIGEHIRINAVASVQDKDVTLKYFGKITPTKNKSHKDYAEKTGAFYKEIEMYKTLFMDISKAVSKDLGRWRPDCYFTRDWDLIIVEDLAVLGYYILPDRTLMGLSYVKVAIKTMALMHAGSIIFEERINEGKAVTQSKIEINRGNRIRIGDLYPNLIFESECSDKPEHPGYTFWECGIRSQLAIVDLLTHYNEKERILIKERFPDAIRQTYSMVKPSKEFRNVMLHADLWGNNILFRNGENGEVSDAIFVDFQMTRYGPPAHDLLMFLHVNQNQEFRNTHESDLIDSYYAHLQENLSKENIDIEKALPRQEFDKSCDYYRRYAILNQMIYTQLPIVSPEICDKYFSTPENYDKISYEDRSEILVECYQTDEFSRQRILEAMDNIILTFQLHK